jgi:hypothetical protein
VGNDKVGPASAARWAPAMKSDKICQKGARVDPFHVVQPVSDPPDVFSA